MVLFVSNIKVEDGLPYAFIYSLAVEFARVNSLILDEVTGRVQILTHNSSLYMCMSFKTLLE